MKVDHACCSGYYNTQTQQTGLRGRETPTQQMGLGGCDTQTFNTCMVTAAGVI